jgi:hypothetical protein
VEAPHLSNRHSRHVRILAISVAAVAATAGIALSVTVLTRTIPIAKIGKEHRLIFKLDAPYGSVDLHPGADPSSVAALLLTDDAASRNPQWSYTMVGKDIGLLHIGIGTDEGALQKPDFVWRASAPQNKFLVARVGTPEPDMGRDLIAQPGPQPATSTKIFLTRDFPMEFSADLGFGESVLDLTRLPITRAYIETGASHATIYANEPNPETMSDCTVKAGVGECSFSGISNLNTHRFHFNGGVGSYRLGFEGKLTQNMEADIDVGIAKCIMTIPAVAARVQVFYDDNMFSSYSFNGLAIRREGYATSPGFDHSNAPILTLRLSSAAGRMAVIYR